MHLAVEHNKEACAVFIDYKLLVPVRVLYFCFGLTSLSHNVDQAHTLSRMKLYFRFHIHHLYFRLRRSQTLYLVYNVSYATLVETRLKCKFKFSEQYLSNIYSSYAPRR